MPGTGLQPLAKFLILIGIVFAATGAFLLLGSRLPFLEKLGKLPGDIRIETKNVRFYFPIVTSLLISVILTVLFTLFKGIKR